MKVSVVIPIYNVEPYIRRCAESILNQDFDDYEVIFVNDATPDDSIAILREVIAENLNQAVRVKIVEHRVNKGPGVARNSGIDVASGDWVTFVDPDDWVEVSYLRNLIAEGPALGDLVLGGVSYDMDASTRRSRLLFNPSSSTVEDVSSLELSNCINRSFTCGKLFDLCLIKSSGLRFLDITPQEDTVFVMSYLLLARRIRFVAACDYHYVLYNQSSLTKRTRTPEEYLRISDLLLDCWTLLFNRFNHLERGELRACVQRFGLSQLLQAVKSLYLCNCRVRRSRFIIVHAVRLRRGWFDEYYMARSLTVRICLFAILHLPFTVVDGIARLCGIINVMIHGCLARRGFR